MENNFNKVMIEVELERNRQIKDEGYTTDVDDRGEAGRLAAAAACYSVHAAFCMFEGPTGQGLQGVPVWWPFDPASWKPKEPRKNLIVAMALIAAEIEKMDRDFSAKNEKVAEVVPEKNS